MRIVPIDTRSPSIHAIRDAADVLRQGGLVAFPTETVYGLGANALDPVAVERIYKAKGRPAYNPLIVHVVNRQAADRVVASWSDAAERLAKAFWPGPLTLVLPKRPIVPDGVTAGLPTVAVRVPAHPVAHALLAAADLPIAAPSANRSMMLSPTTGAHVAKSLGAEVDLLLDGGPTPVGIESTVIDLTREQPTLLRPGMISMARLEKVIGGPVVTVSAGASSGAPRPSPGMLERHYAPRARLVLAPHDQTRGLIVEMAAAGRRVGGLLIGPAPAHGVIVQQMPASADEYASRLFDALHQLDDAGVDIIVAEQVPDGPEWAGVRDRLERASR